MDDKIKFLVICIIAVLLVSFIVETSLILHIERIETGDNIARSVAYGLNDVEKAIKNKDYESAKELLGAAEDGLNRLQSFIDRYGDRYGSLTAQYRQLFARYNSLSKQVSGMSKSASLVGRTISGTAVKIIDGDTFVLRYGQGVNERITIRVVNLECPERGEPNYNYCTNIAKDLIDGKRVTVTIEGQDAFDRYLGSVSFSGGDFANAMKRETHGECK